MDVEFTILVIVFTAAAVFFAVYRWYFSEDAVTRRALRARRRVDIAAVADGATVKIGGTVSCADGVEPLVAPLSGRPCVAWVVVVEEREQAGKTSHWHEVVRDVLAQRFMLDDGTGRAVVEAQRPAVALHRDGHFQSGTFNDASPRLEAFLERYGLKSTGMLGFNKQMRYYEGVIEAGERASAYGTARLEPDPEGGGGAGYRTAAMRVVLVEPEDESMLLSDDESTTA